MELRTLRYLLAVHRAGSVTAASSEVHITQPALSRQLRRLEKDLGFALFARQRSGGLRLSPAGREFLPLAQRLVAQADATLAAASSIAAGRMCHISMVAPGTTLSDVVAPFLATLCTDDALPALRQEVPGSVYDTLEHDTDLAVGTAPPPAHLMNLPLANLPVWAYVYPTHLWVGQKKVSLDALLSETLLVLRPDHHPRRALDQAVLGAGRSYGDILEFDTAEVAQAVAASGKGVAVVSDDPRYGLHPVGIEGPHGALQIRLWAAWHPEHHAAAALADISARLRAFCLQRYGEQASPNGRGPEPDLL